MSDTKKTWIDILSESNEDNVFVVFEGIALEELDERVRQKIIIDYNGKWNAFVMGYEDSKPVGTIPNVEL